MNRRGFIGRLAAFFGSILIWRHAESARLDWLEDELTETTDELARPAHWDYVILEPKHPKRFRAGDIIHFPRTGENCRVTRVEHWRVNETNGCIFVERGIGSKPAMLVAGEPVWILGGAAEMSYEQNSVQVEIVTEQNAKFAADWSARTGVSRSYEELVAPEEPHRRVSFHEWQDMVNKARSLGVKL